MTAPQATALQVELSYWVALARRNDVPRVQPSPRVPRHRPRWLEGKSPAGAVRRGLGRPQRVLAVAQAPTPSPPRASQHDSRVKSKVAWLSGPSRRTRFCAPAGTGGAKVVTPTSPSMSGPRLNDPPLGRYDVARSSCRLRGRALVGCRSRSWSSDQKTLTPSSYTSTTSICSPGAVLESATMRRTRCSHRTSGRRYADHPPLGMPRASHASGRCRCGRVLEGVVRLDGVVAIERLVGVEKPVVCWQARAVVFGEHARSIALGRG
jgi:hypothetical protein